ncbi:MAG: hypothetical protein ACYCVD_04815 [Desulfitobacteriaceae bacterium]
MAQIQLDKMSLVPPLSAAGFAAFSPQTFRIRFLVSVTGRGLLLLLLFRLSSEFLLG